MSYNPTAKVTIELYPEELDTVLAALRWYQHRGMGDTDNRPDWLQEIACPDGGTMTSLCDESIDALCERVDPARIVPGWAEIVESVRRFDAGVADTES